MNSTIRRHSAGHYNTCSRRWQAQLSPRSPGAATRRRRACPSQQLHAFRPCRAAGSWPLKPSRSKSAGLACSLGTSSSMLPPTRRNAARPQCDPDARGHFRRARYLVQCPRPGLAGKLPAIYILDGGAVHRLALLFRRGPGQFLPLLLFSVAHLLCHSLLATDYLRYLHSALSQLRAAVPRLAGGWS